MAGLVDHVRRYVILERPLQSLPRWVAAAMLMLSAASLGWSALAVGSFLSVQEARRTAQVEADFGDVELYSRINARVRDGESYYTAALSEQRQHDYPTRPFVTVRTPVMAWGDLVWGAVGWRVIAVLLLLGNVLAWIGALGRATTGERAGAALLLFMSGAGAFFDKVGLMHDLICGLLLSLSLGLYRRDRWLPALLAAAAAVAVRELALPFVLLWGVFAWAEGRRREVLAVAVVLLVFVCGMLLHSAWVDAARLPGDRASPGWHGMLGPVMPLTSIAELSPLLVLPPVWAGPLALLPLLGWMGLGGRLGLFATLWFAGFGLFVAIFARWANFYWVLLMLPAYLAGLALVPRSFADLLRAIRALPAKDPEPSPVGR